jgi:hypothetical protein
MSEIYQACVKGPESLHPVVAAKVKPWIGKRFSVHGGIMYTQASYISFRDLPVTDAGMAAAVEVMAQMSSFMVPVIPADATVKISEPEQPTAAKADLRDDILLVLHDFRMHAPLGEMQTQVRLVGWWPTVLAACKYHIATCAICLQKRTSAAPPGASTQALMRLAVLIFDHCELDPVIQAATGYWAILTMVDAATGHCVFAPATDKSAKQTSYLIFTQWIRTFGIPRVIRSDGDRGYTSEVMRLARRYLGIKEHDVSAPDQKGTASKAEAANKHVRKAERIMLANGQISKVHLMMYMAAAEIMANQQSEWSGHTSHERLFVQKPVTVVDLIAPRSFPQPDKAEGALGEDDKEWIELFAQRARDMHLRKLESTDERARNVTLANDTVIAASNATVFDLRTGDTVSYKGEAYVLNTLNGPPGELITAMIQQNGKRERKVLYSALRPCATARPVIRLPFMTQCDVDAFVVFDAGDDQIAFGKVITQDACEITIHLHAPNEQQSRWHPLYVMSDGTIDTVTGRKDVPSDAKPHVDQVQLDAVLAVGEITKVGALSAELRDAKRTIGF